MMVDLGSSRRWQLWLTPGKSYSDKCPSLAWFKRRSGKFRPDLDRGSVGGIDGIGHAGKRALDNARSLAILPAKPGKTC
jgi:hypothetical protein